MTFLSGIQDRTEGFFQVLHEYLVSTLGRIQVPAYLEKLNYMVLTGSEIGLVAEFCGAPLEKGRYSIDAKKLEEVYHQIRVMTKEQISERYGLSENQAEILYFFSGDLQPPVRLYPGETNYLPQGGTMGCFGPAAFIHKVQKRL